MKRILVALSVFGMLGCGGGGGGFNGANVQGIWTGSFVFQEGTVDVRMTMIEHQNFTIGGLADFSAGPFNGARDDLTILGIRGAEDLILTFEAPFDQPELEAFKYEATMSNASHMSGMLSDGGFNGEQLDLVKVQDG